MNLSQHRREMHVGEHHYKSRKNIFHKLNINQKELKESPSVGNSKLKS
jgi:hypothetical protein